MEFLIIPIQKGIFLTFAKCFEKVSVLVITRELYVESVQHLVPSVEYWFEMVGID